MKWLAKLFGAEPPGEPPIPEGDPERVAEVSRVLERLRPYVQSDGGDIHLLAVDAEGQVSVRLVGACAHCHASHATLYGALEPALKEELDWFRGLRAE